MDRANIHFTSGYRFSGSLDVERLRESFLAVVEAVEKFAHRLRFMAQDDFAWHPVDGAGDPFRVLYSDDLDRDFGELCRHSLIAGEGDDHQPMRLTVLLSTRGDFRITETLHEDPQTRVYRGLRLTDERPVILKVHADHPSLPESVPKFQHEFDITRSLAGVDGVVQLVDLVNTRGSLMILAEDIGAVSLDRLLAQERFALVEAVELGVGIARILGDIHRHGVIHKDINPANIVWNRKSGALEVIDFGISSMLGHERQAFQSTDRLEGTLAYISPEQTGRLNRSLDYRSDLYSFGITLFELLTGERPFTARQGIELVHAHIALPLPPPHQVDPGIPRPLSQIVLRLTEKMADQRYQSAWGAMYDLERCLAELKSGGRITAFPLGSNDIPVRFQIPQKLYGREHDTARIVAAFDRAAAGEKQLLLVKGAPGVGKSALVQEVYRPLTEKRGNFVSGKFDQYQRDVPFYAWTMAFQELSNLLLQEDEAALLQWRSRILSAVGGLGRALTDVVPSIELSIGKQPEVPALSGEQALNRLNYVLGNFIQAVASREHPLVIFIDDWQWADAGSLSLLRFVLSSGSRQDHLLLIGAYRDNEVDATHPFSTGPEDVVQQADRALYLAKDSGRNRLACLPD